MSLLLPVCAQVLTGPTRRWPHPSLLPTALLDKAAHNVLTNKSVGIPGMLYGPDPGDPRVLAALDYCVVSMQN